MIGQQLPLPLLDVALLLPAPPPSRGEMEQNDHLGTLLPAQQHTGEDQSGQDQGQCQEGHGGVEAFPDRLINVGIAEQDMVGVAAGLAGGGRIPFVSAASCFLTARALEQIRPTSATRTTR